MTVLSIKYTNFSLVLLIKKLLYPLIGEKPARTGGHATIHFFIRIIFIRIMTFRFAKHSKNDSEAQIGRSKKNNFLYHLKAEYYPASRGLKFTGLFYKKQL